LVNVAYAQVEGWLVLMLVWLLDDESPVKSSLAIIALLFKPAYGIFLVPYRLWCWLRSRQYKSLAWLVGTTLVTMGAATLVEPAWPVQWFVGVMHRHENVNLTERNMTIWAFTERGGVWLVVLSLFLILLMVMSWRLLRFPEARGEVLLAWSLFFFPGGLNPVSSMMIMPLVREKSHIIILVIISWLVVGIESLMNGFGGMYLLIVLAALALRLRFLLTSTAVHAQSTFETSIEGNLP
jgi:hypothetical protein